MKQQLRARLGLEQLETRWCPAVSANSFFGFLFVSGSTNPGDTVTIKETAANTFEVDQNATVVKSGLTANNILVAVSGTTYSVNVDLGTFSLSGNLAIKLGQGDSATVTDGSIGGGLAVFGGNKDTVTLGGTGTLSVARDVAVHLGGSGNTLTVDGGVTLSRNLITGDANTLTLAAGSSVGQSVIISGSSAGNTIDVEGSVGQNLDVFNPFFQGNKSASTSVTLGAAASVGHDLVFTNSFFNTFNSQLTTKAGSTIGGSLYDFGSGKGDVVNLGGSIAKNAILDFFRGNNQVTLASGSTISGTASFFLGGGNNSLTLAGTVGASGNTALALGVFAGNGTNTVDIQGTAIINGNALVHLGSGVNKLDVHDSATVTGTLHAQGGGNAATEFRGTVRANFTISGFPIIDSSPNP
jgi:hypothetical protein